VSIGDFLVNLTLLYFFYFQGTSRRQERTKRKASKPNMHHILEREYRSTSITHSLEMSLDEEEQSEFVHKNIDKQYLNIL